jgi:signal peptidase II
MALLSFSVRTTLFSFATAIVLAACLAAIARRRSLTISVLGLTLVVAGGLSNLVDRVARGFVVDFLNVGVGPLRTGIFNVADMAIMTGIALASHRRPATDWYRRRPPM